MADKRVYYLVHEAARKLAAAQCFLVEDGWVCRIEPPNKTRDQEEKYHAIFSDVAKQCKHLNREFTIEGWKRLLIDQFAREMLSMPDCDPDIRENLKNAVEMVPSLDGRAIVSIGIQSKNFKKKTAMAFITWLLAFADQNNVRLKNEQHP